MENITNNYQQDLIKSQKTPLLIELLKKDIEKFDNELGLKKSILTAQYIYNTTLDDKKNTNLIYIDGDKYSIDNSSDKNPIILFETLINLSSVQIKSLKNIDIVKSGVKSALSYFTGGFLKDHIGGYVDAGIDQVSDLLSGTAEDIVDYAVEELDFDFTQTILDEITDNVNSILYDSSKNALENVVDKELYLSKESEEKLGKLSSKFGKDLSAIELFSLILQFVLATSIESQKLIFINNPHKLDKDSLAILSLLFSFAKDLKDKDTHSGISVVYCYSDENFQPYEKVADKYSISKKLLDDQRRFTQRYAMLERPTSDIPNIAIKSSMFVGRVKELEKLQESFDKSKQDREFKNLEVIVADPGIGKTKLVKKHIQQVRDNENNGQRIIQLNILNQIGHSSSNTGLSSLKDSIMKEAKRLATIKTMETTIIDKIKDAGKSEIINSIENLLGINNIVEMGGAIYEAMNHEKNIMKTLDSSSNDLNNQDANSKEKEFEDIRESILKLQELSDEALPIILFIDDLQWIDENSSEFILKYFTQTWKFNTYIVSTLRWSDAVTALKTAQDNASLNPYTISLLQQAKVKTDTPLENPEDITTLETNTIQLKGLDEKNLTELLSLTIQGNNSYHTIVAKAIIKNLLNETQIDKEYVNTLFAIETINMLCDEKLYSSNKDIKKQLILQNPLSYNEEIKEFNQVLEGTFKIVNSKYQDGFEHANSDKKFEQQFNLMAYAVLEERLHILKEYFDSTENLKYGNAAVNTLLLSSLLGAPFSSNIVKNVIKTLSTTDEPFLKHIKDEFTKDGSITLDSMHYEIIEEVYEILSRYLVIENAYSYKHNLLEIFLDKQFEYLLDKLLGKDNIQARDSLYTLILEQIDIEEQKQEFYGKHKQSLNSNQYENVLFFKNLTLNILEKGFHNNRKLWLNNYISELGVTATLYGMNNQIKKAVYYFDKLIDIYNNLTNEEKVEISYIYSNAINNKFTLLQFEDIENNSKQLIKILDNENLDNFAKIVISSTLGDFLYKSEKYDDSLRRFNFSYKYLQNEIDKVDKYSEEKAKLFINTYLNSLIGISVCLRRKKEFENALKFAKEAYNSSKKYITYISMEYFVKASTSLANILAENKDKNALTIIEEALVLVKNNYDNNQSIWFNQYITTLFNKTKVLNELKYFDESLTSWKEIIKVFEDLLKGSDEIHETIKIQYAAILHQYNKFALTLDENNYSSLDIQEFCKDKLETLNNVLVNKKVLLYYVSSIIDLSKTYSSIDTKKSLELDIMAHQISSENFSEDIDSWIDLYSNALRNLSISFYNFEKIEQSNKLRIKNYKITKDYYLKNKEDKFINLFRQALQGVYNMYLKEKDFKNLANITKELYDIDVFQYGENSTEAFKTLSILDGIEKEYNKVQKDNYLEKTELHELLSQLEISQNQQLYSDNKIRKIIQNNDINLLESIILQGLSVNHQIKFGQSLAYLAVLENNVEILKLLVKHGADINLQEIEGSTPLIIASYNHYVEILKFLLENGANIEQKDNNGRTALLYAIYAGDIDVIKILIENGANINVTDNKGKNSLYWAKEQGHQDIILFIESLKIKNNKFNLLKEYHKQMEFNEEENNMYYRVGYQVIITDEFNGEEDYEHLNQFRGNVYIIDSLNEDEETYTLKDLNDNFIDMYFMDYELQPYVE